MTHQTRIAGGTHRVRARDARWGERLLTDPDQPDQPEGTTREAAARDTTAPDPYADTPEVTPAQLRNSLARRAIMPDALATTTCEEHGAALGEPCFALGGGTATGICGPRLALARLAVPDTGLVSDHRHDDDWLHRQAERVRSGSRLRYRSES